MDVRNKCYDGIHASDDNTTSCCIPAVGLVLLASAHGLRLHSTTVLSGSRDLQFNSTTSNCNCTGWLTIVAAQAGTPPFFVACVYIHL